MNNPEPTPAADSAPDWRPLSLDTAAYRHHLADYDWTDAQKDQFIEDLWKILVGFIDRDLGLDPLQHVMPRPTTLDRDSDTMVASDRFSNSNKKEVASAFAEAAAERTNS